MKHGPELFIAVDKNDPTIVFMHNGGYAILPQAILQAPKEILIAHIKSAGYKEEEFNFIYLDDLREFVDAELLERIPINTVKQ